MKKNWHLEKRLARPLAAAETAGGGSGAVPAVCLDRQGQLSQPITVHWQAAGRFPLNPIKLSSLINYNK